MKEKREQSRFRPNERDFNEKIRYVREAQNTDLDAYETYTTEIPQYARGEGDQDTREQFYPGWTTEDFQTLLERLQQEGLVEK